MGLEHLFQKSKKKVKNTFLAMLASSFLFFSTCDDPSKLSEPPQKNNPPTIISNPITQVDENKDYSYQVNAKDDDGDKLTYSLIEKPNWLSISDTIISGTAPDVLEDKNFSVKVKVSDGKDYTEQPYTLTVKNLHNTRVLTEQNLNQLSSVQNNSLVFSNPVDFLSQDILVAGISDITPQGFLREVTDLSSDKKTVNTTPATIEQITEDTSFFFQRSIYPSDSLSFSGKMGISEMEVSKGFNFNIEIKDVVIYDKDGRPETTMDRITLNGNFGFNLDFSLDFDISKGQINKLDFRNIIDANAEIELDMISSLNFLSHEVKIAKYVFNPIIAYIPPSFPIIIVPELSLYAGVRGELDSPKIRLTNETNLMPQIIYKNNQWNELSTFINNFDFNFSEPTKANFNYKAYIGPKLDISLYGVAGPYAEANIYSQLVASEEDWKLYGGLEAILGVKAKIFSHTLLSCYKRVIDFKKTLKEGKINLNASGEILFVSGPEYSIYDLPQIYTINEDGSNMQKITNLQYHLFSNFEPRASPDGNKIVFVSKPDANTEPEIYIMELNTGNTTRLTNNFYEDINPDWSPDGSKIGFSSDRIGGGDRNIYIMDSNGLNPQRLNLPSKILNTETPRWSPDGQLIAFDGTETGSDYDIYVVYNDGSGLKKLVNNDYLDIEPSWSPDGSKIAFTSNRDGNREIYIINLDGTNEKRLTDDPALDAQPSWSPDGKRIVFISDRVVGYNQLHVMNSDGSEVRRIVTKEDNIDRTPSYLPQKNN